MTTNELLRDSEVEPTLSRYRQATGEERTLLKQKLERWQIAAKENIQRDAEKQIETLYSGLEVARERFMGDKLVAQSPDPDEVIAGGLNQRVVSDQLGKTLDEVAQIWPTYRTAYAQSEFGQDVKTDKELYSLLSGKFQQKKAQREFAENLRGMSVVHAFEDLATGTATSPVERVKAEILKNPEAFKGLDEAQVLEQYGNAYAGLRNEIAPYQGVAKLAFDTLAGWTGADAAPKVDEKGRADVENLARSFIDLAPTDREKVYEVVALAAKAKGAGDTKTFFQKMGESLSRGAIGAFDETAIMFKDAETRNNLSLLKDGAAKLVVWENGRIDTEDSARLALAATQGQPGQTFSPVEDRAELIQNNEERLKQMQVLRELKALADGTVDPIKPSNAGLMGDLEGGLYSATRSVPYTLMAGIPYVGPVMTYTALAAADYNRLMLENPEMDSGAAMNLAMLTAAPQAALERAQFGILAGRLPGFTKAVKSFSEMNPPGWLRAGGIVAGGVGAATLGEFTTESLQDMVPIISDTLAASIREDMPDFDADKAWGAFKESSPDRFWAVLPLALIGGGVSSVRELRRPPGFMELKMGGIPDAKATEIVNEPDPEKKDALIVAAWGERKPEDIKAGEQLYNQVKSATEAAQQDPNQMTVDIKREDDGNVTYILKAPNGAELYRSQNPEAIDQALINEGQSREMSRILDEIAAETGEQSLIDAGQESELSAVLGENTEVASENIQNFYDLKWVKQNFSTGDKIDADAASLYVSKKAEESIKSGGTVTIQRDSKSISIKSIRNGMLIDSDGQPWGTAAMLFPKKGSSDGILITDSAPAFQPTEQVEMFSPEQIQGLRQKLNLSKNEGGFINPEIVAEVANFGRSIYRQGIQYAEWSLQMVRSLGDGVRSVLRQVWDSLTGAGFLPGARERGAAMVPDSPEVAQRDSEYLAAVESGDMETAQRMVDEAAKAAGFDIGPVWHGGANGFTVFDWSRIGQQGTSEGKGFYFSNDRDLAAGYAERHGGRLLQVYLRSGKPIDPRKQTITKPQWRKILQRIHSESEKVEEGSTPLWNYGDIQNEGIQRVIDEAVQNTTGYAESDVDAIAGFLNGGADPQITYDAIYNITGKTGITESEAWGKKGHVIHVATSPNHVKLADPVTRDNNGNIIPLSRRFDKGPDIRGMAESIKKKLAKSEGGFINAEILSEITDYGRAIFKQGMDFAAWSAEMVAQLGEKVRSVLQQIWKSISGQNLLPSARQRGSIGGAGITQVEDRLTKAMKSPEKRLEIFQRAQKRLSEKMRENRAVIEAMQFSRGASKRELEASGIERAKPYEISREKLLQSIGELNTLLSFFPAEIRGKVGGFATLANIGTGEKALTDFFVKRVEMLDVELERALRKEYDARLKKLFKRTKPKEDKAGKKKIGKAGADVHSLFATLQESVEWTEAEVEAHINKLEAEIQKGEMTPEQEAHALQEIGLVSLIGNWKNADSARRDAAIRNAEEVFAKGYSAFKIKVQEERERRKAIVSELQQDAGVAGTAAERDQKAIDDNGLKGGWKDSILSLVNFEQTAKWVFGDKSKQAEKIADMEREASNKKADREFAKLEAIDDFFTKLAGGKRLDGQKLQYSMSRKTIEAEGRKLSQLEGIKATMMWEQDDGRRHMMGQRDENGKPVGKWSYDQAFVDAIESQLTPEAREVREFLRQEYSAEYAEINPVYRELNGIDMPSNRNYSPLTVKPMQAQGGQTLDPVTGNTFSTGSATPGSLRTRGTATAEPDFSDALQTYIAHTKQIGHWLAYAPLIKEVAPILNSRDLGNVIEAKGGQQAVDVLRGWTNYFTQGGSRDAGSFLQLNRFLQSVASRAASVALVGRIGTIAIQSTQLGAAAAEMPMKDYASRIGKLFAGQLGWGEAFNSPYIQRRLKQLSPIVRMAMDGLRAEKPNQLRYAVQKLAQLIGGADAFFTAGTYAIVYDYQIAQAKEIGLTGQEAEAYARNAAERAVDRIAQPTRPGARSLYENTLTNPLARVGWAFASEARKNLGLSAYSLAKRSPQEAGRALMYVFLLNGIMATIIRNAWRDSRDDEDDEIFDEKYWNPKSMLLAVATEPLYGIPGIGDAFQAAVMAAAGEYVPEGNLFSSMKRGVPPIKRIPETIAGERETGEVLRDVEAILTAFGLFNSNIAATASLSHLARDLFGVAENVAPDDETN